MEVTDRGLNASVEALPHEAEIYLEVLKISRDFLREAGACRIASETAPEAVNYALAAGLWKSDRRKMSRLVSCQTFRFVSRWVPRLESLYRKVQYIYTVDEGLWICARDQGWLLQSTGPSFAMESQELICVEASSLAFLASLLTSRRGGDFPLVLGCFF